MSVARINQLQRQLIVHSVIYYRLNASVWTDAQWDSASTELLSLKQEKPDLFRLSLFDASFEDFDGSTGMHLGQDNISYWATLGNQLISTYTDGTL